MHAATKYSVDVAADTRNLLNLRKAERSWFR
jgi:hypothetical protein